VTRLADIFAMASVNPSTTVTTINDAVTPLQNVRVRLADLEAVRTRLGSLFDSAGTTRLATEHANAPGAAVNLPATTVRGVSATSVLGRKLGSLTVGGVADQERNAFIERMLEGVAANQQAAVRQQAGEIWDAASETTTITSSWRTARG
jgi:hypothetical protein